MKEAEGKSLPSPYGSTEEISIPKEAEHFKFYRSEGLPPSEAKDFDGSCSFYAKT